MKPEQIQIMWNGPPQCEHCDIRSLVLFSALRREDFALIHDPIQEPEFMKGETLYHANESGRYLYTVREGVVKLVTSMSDGHERITRILKRGDVAGLEVLVGDQYQHSAVAMESTLTCRIPINVVSDLSKQLPDFHKQLLNRWQRALIEAEITLTELGVGPVKKRLARLFLHLSELEPDGICFLPRVEDLGAMLGVTTESASRAAAELKRAGLISPVSTHQVSINAVGLQDYIY